MFECPLKTINKNRDFKRVNLNFCVFRASHNTLSTHPPTISHKYAAIATKSSYNPILTNEQLIR